MRYTWNIKDEHENTIACADITKNGSCINSNIKISLPRRHILLILKDISTPLLLSLIYIKLCKR